MTECHIPVVDANRSKGYGFVKFDSTVGATKAIDATDGRDFQGRILHVLLAWPERNIGSGNDMTENDTEGSM